jgi:hypothetical protein
MLSRRLTISIAVGATAVVVAVAAYVIVSASSTTSSAGARTAQTARPGSNARSGPASGGTSGKVATVSTHSFTVLTPAGQKATVDEASSTAYQKGKASASASVITAGEPVLVLGTTSGTTITATEVIVQPAAAKSGTSSAKVIPFQRGAPTTSKQVGQIPANYSQGSGTIVSGTPANKATEAALAAYPGGIVDRVVKLGNGDYEVHCIGVNWPHHIFVDKSGKVIGAD